MYNQSIRKNIITKFILNKITLQSIRITIAFILLKIPRKNCTKVKIHAASKNPSL